MQTQKIGHINPPQTPKKHNYLAKLKGFIDHYLGNIIAATATLAALGSLFVALQYCEDGDETDTDTITENADRTENPSAPPEPPFPISDKCGCIGVNLLDNPDPHVSGIPLVPADCVVPNPRYGLEWPAADQIREASFLGLCSRRDVSEGIEERHDPNKERCLLINGEASWLKISPAFYGKTDVVFPCSPDPWFNL